MPNRRFPIRRKLTIATLFPLLVALVCCWLIGVSILTTRIVEQAQTKVRSDLNAARAIYHHETERVGDVVRLTAQNPYLANAMAAGDRQALTRLLPPLLRSEKLDILNVIDARGSAVYRSANPESHGDDRSRDPFVSRSLRGVPVSGTTVLSPEDVAFESPALGQQATINVLQTPRARPNAERIGRAGMFLVAAAPIVDPSGNTLGVLYGGILVNNNNELVDLIKRTVFAENTREGLDLGNATIFMDDLRIATNVQTDPGRRAIGTRMSEEVYRRVILSREKWFDRAFVVNDWYYAAYEPILSLEGVPLGALYVGMRERPYADLKVRLAFLFSGVLLVGSLAGLACANLIARRLARPVKELEGLVRRVAAGERGLTSTIAGNDEISDLAAEFNQMSLALELQDEEIRGLTRGLEDKVQERTLELEEKHRQLVAAREELARAERLAAIGELAAGVAHEINNPMAIIRGNAELLQTALPSDRPEQEEVGIIVLQVGRVERIVASLLQFARRQSRRLHPCDLNQLLDETLAQIGHQAPLTGITVTREVAPDLPAIGGDPDQLRQVVTNLVLNAIQAMPNGGTLRVATSRRPDDTVELTVTDSGQGIPAANLEQIFNPFFTTRPGGTGLGLAVSYGIVKNHGGSIEVESREGAGATFRVVFPARQDQLMTAAAN